MHNMNEKPQFGNAYVRQKLLLAVCTLLAKVKNNTSFLPFCRTRLAFLVMMENGPLKGWLNCFTAFQNV